MTGTVPGAPVSGRAQPAADFYERQISVPEIGTEGQARLRRSGVLVIGAGGLGSPLLMALAGAGVGRIGLIDADTVSAGNLNRQFLYTPEDIGLPKAVQAGRRLRAYHPDLLFEIYGEYLTEELAERLFAQYDLIAAAVDNNRTRRLINRICCRLRKPLVDGGLRGFSGYVASVEPGRTPCFDCLFGYSDLPLSAEPDLPGQHEAPDPAHAAERPGALGVTAGVLGSLEANLVLLSLLGLPNPIAGEIFTYNGKSMSFDRLTVERTPGCLACGSLS